LARDWTTSTPFANSVILSSNILPTWIRGCADAIGLIAVSATSPQIFRSRRDKKLLLAASGRVTAAPIILNYYHYISIDYRNFFGLRSARKSGR
jgi:hypothetical protein